MPQPVRVVGMSLAVVLSIGCASPYSAYYHDFLDGKSVDQVPSLVPHDGEPQVYSARDFETDRRALTEDGYILIGYSSFNATIADPRDAISHARRIGAAIVLLESRHASTERGATSYALQNLPGGYTIHHVPYSIDRYDFGATFWAKAKSTILGIAATDLSADDRIGLSRNRGAVVDVVIKRSPAFDADIMRGDVITKFNGELLTDASELSEMTRRHAGKEVVLEIFRDGRPQEVKLRLNPAAY